MSSVRRSFAALCGLLLLQLMLLGSGTLRAAHGGMGNDGMARNAMSMPSMAHVMTSDGSVIASSGDGGGPTSPTDCRGEHGDCHLPFAPGHCSAMTTCAVTAKPAATVVVSASARTSARAVSTRALVPLGPTFAPELPPPRA